MRKRFRPYMLFLLLGYPLGLRAEVSPGVATDPPAPHAAASAASRKHHHKHKKTANGSAASQKPVAGSLATDSHTGADAGNTDARGMSNSLGNNIAGTPNMGSPDHTPGTTGTSGQ